MPDFERFPICLLAAGILLATAGARADDVCPNDPHYSLQWGLRNAGQVIGGVAGKPGADVDAPGAWSIHRGASTVVVAVVGRGIDPHPEFGDRLLEGISIFGDPLDTRDSCPHDTHLAGIIAAGTSNGMGIAGLNGRAFILPVRVLDGCGGTEASAALGIRWAVDHGAGIILAAVQFYQGTEALQEAITYALDRDVLVVAPVGSIGGLQVAFPARFEGVLAVAATNQHDEVTALSNRGAEVDISAPGEHIWSTWIGGDYAFMPEGRDTAVAAAFVTGAAALLRSYAPQMSATELAQLLRDTADDVGAAGWDERSGFGRIDASRALDTAIPPPIRFAPLEPLPRMIPPEVPSSFLIRWSDGTERVNPDSAQCSFRVDSSEFTTAPVERLYQDVYRVNLPALPCATFVEYYLMATSKEGTTLTDPPGAPIRLHKAWSVYDEILFEDDFEVDRNWLVEGGDNVSGRWSRVDPVGTVAQPEYDATSDGGRFCYVTGQHFGGHPGTNDVDGGPLTLTSPIVEIDDPGAAVIYSRWFETDGDDVLTVQLSRDGGTQWATAETIGPTGGWTRQVLILRDFPELTGHQLRVRFVAADTGLPSLTEAAVDEFRVLGFGCSVMPGDGNNDGYVDLVDAEAMTNCLRGPGVHIEGGACAALDFDHDYRIDLGDVAAFQRTFPPP